MRVTINRAELLNAAKCASAIAPASSPIKEMSGVLLETDAASGKMTATATNMETSLELKLSCVALDDDALAVNAKLLASMLDNLPGDTVELLRRNGQAQIHLRSGDAEYLVPIFERGSFPKPSIPFPEDTVRVTGVPSMARRAVFAACRDKNAERPLLKCINLMFTEDGLRAAGSDGICIVSVSGDNKSTGNINFLIPALSLEKLARMCSDADEFHVGTTGKTLVFMRENFLYSTRLLEGQYIDPERLTGSIVKQFTILTDIPELRKALESAATVDPDGKVSLSLKGQRLTFHCIGRYGTASSAIDVIPLSGACQGEFWFQIEQFSACLRALTGTARLSIAQGGMLVLETEDAFYMQTAARPAAVKAAGTKKTPLKQAA